MADNVILPGEGDTVASDDIGGAQFQRVKLIHGADGVNDGDVSSDNGLPISTGKVSDTGANTDTVISGGNWSGDTYTGTGEKILHDYVSVNLQVDEAGTLFFDFSQDGTNYSTFPVAGFPVASGINEVHGAYKFSNRFFRVRFVGTGGRTYFRLLTEYTSTPVVLNSPLSQGVSGDQDASTVKAIVHGEDFENAGTFIQQKLTSDGAARMSPVNTLIKFEFDDAQLVIISDTVDTWEYYLNAVLVGTIEITYNDAAHTAIIRQRNI